MNCANWDRARMWAICVAPTASATVWWVLMGTVGARLARCLLGAGGGGVVPYTRERELLFLIVIPSVTLVCAAVYGALWLGRFVTCRPWRLVHLAVATLFIGASAFLLASRVVIYEPTATTWPLGWLAMWGIGVRAGLSFAPGALGAALWLRLTGSSPAAWYPTCLAAQGVAWCPFLGVVILVMGQGVSIPARLSSLAIMLAVPMLAVYLLERLVRRQPNKRTLSAQEADLVKTSAARPDDLQQ